jgi:hypothetical protein
MSSMPVLTSLTKELRYANRYIIEIAEKELKRVEKILCMQEIQAQQAAEENIMPHPQNEDLDLQTLKNNIYSLKMVDIKLATPPSDDCDTLLQVLKEDTYLPIWRDCVDYLIRQGDCNGTELKLVRVRALDVVAQRAKVKKHFEKLKMN